MRNAMTGAVLNVLFAIGSAAAMPPTLTLPQLLDFCDSQTIASAEAKGDQLGWRRMTDADLKDWRTGFIAYNGGSVEVSGWRRGDKASDDSLSFWVARGPNEHRACAYTVTDPARLFDDLSERFGTPTSLDKREFGTTAVWKRGSSAEISFSQVGSSAVLYVAHSD
jgi:hypothetical protein